MRKDVRKEFKDKKQVIILYMENYESNEKIEWKDFINRLSFIHKQIMTINIYVDSSDNTLKNMYVEAANKHNQKIMNDPYFYDAGFDLFLPKLNEINEKRIFWQNPEFNSNKVDFEIKCCAKMIYTCDSMWNYTPFYTYARSSISKTPLRLANNQGIIDAGYRGSLIGMFDSLSSYYMEPYTRLLQICAPNLVPIYVNIVDNIEDLGPTTSRGEGGFGSTGK